VATRSGACWGRRRRATPAARAARNSLAQVESHRAYSRHAQRRRFMTSRALRQVHPLDILFAVEALHRSETGRQPLDRSPHLAAARVYDGQVRCRFDPPSRGERARRDLRAGSLLHAAGVRRAGARRAVAGQSPRSVMVPPAAANASSNATEISPALGFPTRAPLQSR